MIDQPTPDHDPLPRWCERDPYQDNTFALAALYGDATGFPSVIQHPSPSPWSDHDAGY